MNVGSVVCEKDKVIYNAVSPPTLSERGVNSGACALRGSRHRASHRSGCRFFFSSSPSDRRREEQQEKRRATRQEGPGARKQEDGLTISCLKKEGRTEDILY